MSKREFFPCYHSYFKKCEKLTDQELGRLFRALLRYSSTGERQELAGRESIAFDFIADDIDRAEVAYLEKCEKNAQNGKHGGRQKNQTVSEKANGSEKSERFKKNQTVSEKANGFKKSQDEDEDKDEAKNEDKPKNPPLAPPPGGWGFGPVLTGAFESWLAYKHEKRQDYKPTGLQSLVSQVRTKAAEYGEDAVADLIRECMASNWQGIIWDRLERMSTEGRNRQAECSGDVSWMKDLIAKRKEE